MENRVEPIPYPFCSNGALPAAFTDALSFNEQIQWLLNAYNNLLSILPDNIEYGGVKYVKQALTENEKAIARENIGAGTSDITENDIDNSIKNNTVSYKKSQNLTEGEKELARKNIGAGTSNAQYAVEYVDQKLTEQQKEDARKNIGAASDKLSGAVLTTPQNLSENEQLIARTNIGVPAGVTDVPVLFNRLQTYPDSMKAQARKNIDCPSMTYYRAFQKRAEVDEWETIGGNTVFSYCKIVKNTDFIYTYENLMLIAKTSNLAWIDEDGVFHYPAEISESDITYVIVTFDDGEKWLAARVAYSRKPTKKTYIVTELISTPVSDFPTTWREEQTTPSRYDVPIIITRRDT